MSQQHCSCSKEVWMYYRSGNGVRCGIGARGQMLRVYSIARRQHFSAIAVSYPRFISVTYRARWRCPRTLVSCTVMHRPRGPWPITEQQAYREVKQESTRAGRIGEQTGEWMWKRQFGIQRQLYESSSRLSDGRQQSTRADTTTSNSYTTSEKLSVTLVGSSEKK